jgi:uncharacterized integral membrane protein (TIGR00698 family)
VRWLPGVLAALVAAAVGFAVHAVLPVLPWLTASLVLGVIVGNVPALRLTLDRSLKPGLALSSRRLLRIGIVLLGLRLSLVDIAALGWRQIVGIVLLVGVSFALVYALGRAFRLPGDEPVLLAAGFSICGVSAIGAMAGARGSDERDQAAPVALVTLCGTAAIALLPAIAPALGMGGPDLGRWIGASVHDVGQVVATASVGGSAVLAAAVVVKLTRVLMLAPMVAIASARARRSSDAARRPPVVPLFVAGFVVAVVIRTVVPLSDGVLAVADVVQSALLAAALFAIGASLRLERLVRTGGRSVAVAVIGWAGILALSFGLVTLT